MYECVSVSPGRWRLRQVSMPEHPPVARQEPQLYQLEPGDSADQSQEVAACWPAVCSDPRLGAEGALRELEVFAGSVTVRMPGCPVAATAISQDRRKVVALVERVTSSLFVPDPALGCELHPYRDKVMLHVQNRALHSPPSRTARPSQSRDGGSYLRRTRGFRTPQRAG